MFLPSRTGHDQSHKGLTQNVDVRIVFQSVQFSDSLEPIRKEFTLGRKENDEVGDTLEASLERLTTQQKMNVITFILLQNTAW